MHSPYGLTSMGSTLFVCDSGNGAIRLISNGKPLKDLSAVLYPYAEIFNLDHYRDTPRYTFSQALSTIDQLLEFFFNWGMQTKE